MSDSSSSEATQPAPVSAKPPKPVPSGETKATLFDDGMGDYRILMLRGDGSFAFPPDNPGFKSQRDAQIYIRNSGDEFANLQLAIVRFADFVSVLVQSTPKVALSYKPRS